MSAERERRLAAVAAVPIWFHSIDLGHGVVTPGVKTAETHAQELERMRWPDLCGKTVLDIGAWDGFYSFEAERRGAARVVALDHYVWALDLPADHHVLKEWIHQGDVLGQRLADGDVLSPEQLPGKRGFDVAHAALDSQVEAVVGDFMRMDLDQLGSFDVVLFAGVLYHLKNPLAAMERLRHVTRELAIVETLATLLPGWDHIAVCEFFEGDYSGDPSNWWAPNTAALEGLCRAGGFHEVQTVAGPPEYTTVTWPLQPVRYRHVLHARPRAIVPSAWPPVG